METLAFNQLIQTMLQRCIWMNSGGELIFKVRNIHLHDESIDGIVHK